MTVDHTEHNEPAAKDSDIRLEADTFPLVDYVGTHPVIHYAGGSHGVLRISPGSIRELVPWLSYIHALPYTHAYVMPQCWQAGSGFMGFVRDGRGIVALHAALSDSPRERPWDGRFSGVIGQIGDQIGLPHT